MRIADRLAAVQRQSFVGREAELELFRAALQAEEPPFVALHVYGPGGVGKTTLLHEYSRLAAEQGRFVIYLDGHHLEPNPRAFTTAVQQAIPAPTSEALFMNWPSNSVLLIDTYETLVPLDHWLRATFLPQMPVDALVVIAGRQAPDAWQSDAGWTGLTRIISLSNLRPEDGHTYLTVRGVPHEEHAAALAFTHGHPLALALIANLYQKGAALNLTQSADEKDVIHILLQRFLQDVPSSQQRQALELCVVAWTTTEALLAELFGNEAAFDLFQWMRQLSFIEQGAYGLFPHDLVREVLDADLLWRNPTGYAHLQLTAMKHLRKRFEQVGPLEKQRNRLAHMFIRRHTPGMEAFFAWNALDTAYAEPANPTDFPEILAMVRAHEGEESAGITQHWVQRQPEAFLVYRTNTGELYGFMCQLALQQATEEDMKIDPAVKAAWHFAQAHQPTGTSDAILHLRFWMAQTTYQDVSLAVNLSAANCVIHWTTTPGLVWSFVAMSNPDFMSPHFESIDFPRTPEADFWVGNRRYGVFSHNWIVEPVSTWPKYISQMEKFTSQAEAEPFQQDNPFSEAEFADAVRRALRDYTRPDLLASNPLLQSRLLSKTDQTPGALQAVLRETIANLNQNPKDARLYRALWYTYIEPEATQEKTAERLELPFNTYRYHLTNGLERVTAALWQRKLPT